MWVCLGSSCLDFLCFLGLVICVLLQIWEFLSHYFSKYIFEPPLSSSPSGTPEMQSTVEAIPEMAYTVLIFLKKCYFFALLIGWSPFILSSTSLVCSTVSFSLLLFPSSVFFISVIMLIFFSSGWFFSSSLLKLLIYSSIHLPNLLAALILILCILCLVKFFSV